MDNGYNMTDGGEGLSGYKVSDETKRKLSEAKKGKHVSEETKRKLSKVLKGRRFTEEHKKKIGLSRIGHKHSEETKKRLSEMRKGQGNVFFGKKRPDFAEKMKGEGNPFFGKTHTQETIRKIIEANKGKPAYNKGKTYDELFTPEKAKWLREHAINNAVKTVQMDLDGNIIKVWNSAKEASRELGIEYTGICKCRKGEFKTYHNFIWKPYTD